jgi:predicted enzyme related to lactoylglutathione lyase
MSEKSNSDKCRLGLLVVFSDDMEKAAEFYSAIGLRFERHAHPPCGEHYSTLDDECVFEICQLPAGREKGPPMTFGFRVPSVDRAVEAAVTHGGRIKRKPQTADWGRSATVIDMDGNSILLMEKAERSASL